ncbi:MAG: WbqC family protein [Chitinophagaceae bacterium]|nr:WbqC family protein [Chitinophagaceae bacterium]
MKKTILSSLPFLPNLEFFSLLLGSNAVTFDIHEHYIKGTYRNRCEILSAHKVLFLTVPVKHEKMKSSFKDIRIDYQQRWENRMCNAIRSAYGKSAFFDFYADIFFKTLHSRYEKLWELNHRLFLTCNKMLNATIEYEFSQNYITPNTGDHWIDIRELKKRDNKHFMSMDKRFCNYYQMFGNTFIPNLSIIDFLFCKGKFF